MQPNRMAWFQDTQCYIPRKKISNVLFCGIIINENDHVIKYLIIVLLVSSDSCIKAIE